MNIDVNINNINIVVHEYHNTCDSTEIVLSFGFLITLSQSKLMSYDCYLMRKSTFDFYSKSHELSTSFSHKLF